MGTIADIARRQLTRTTHRIHALPVLILMPHSQCNCRCVMCDIWRANHDRRQLSPDDVARHLDSLRKLGVRRVVLSGGEALMHQDLWSLCAVLKKIPAKITLLSTGLLLSRHASNVIGWCDDVTVSLDGSPPVHDGIRNVPGAFERLADGIRSLKSLAPGFPVRARCVVQRRNFFDLPKIVDTAHELGLDQISFLAVDVSTTAFNRPSPWQNGRLADVLLSPNEVVGFTGIVEQTIVSHQADFKSGFIAETPEKLRRLPHYFAAIQGHGEFPETVCNAPWVSAVVEADGTVRPCFFHRPLGNAREQPLETILNSAEAINFRRGLDVRRDPICRKCVCTLNLRPRATVP